MNLLLNDRQAEAIRTGKAVPIVLGNFNSAQILAGANGKVFEITNNVGSDVHVLGVSIRFPATFDSCIFNLLNTQQNRPVMSGATPLGTVGVSSALASNLDLLPIVPFILTSGNFVDVLLSNNTAGPLPIRGLLVSLYGLQLQ